MTAHPVDSTYYRCCNAIGRHAHGCAVTTLATLAQVPAPDGATTIGSWHQPPAGGHNRCFKSAEGIGVQRVDDDGVHVVYLSDADLATCGALKSR